MRTTVRWLIAVALLCAVAVTGCGDDDDEAGSESTADGGGDGGNGGDDGDGGDGGVPGSPIDVPAFTASQGLFLDEVLPRIEREITELCGGEMCLELRVEMSNEDFQECRFVGTDPPAGGQVERGGTLVVVAGTQPCEGEPPDDGDSDDDEPPDSDDDDADDQPADDDDDLDDTQAPGETP